MTIIELPGQTRNTIATVEIDGYGTLHNIQIDSNAITSAHSRNNAFTKLLNEAIQSENDGKGGIYYWDKNKALAIMASIRGVQFPGTSTIASGSVRSIYDPLSKVNPRIKNIYDTKQFKRWFGDSKVVNEDGTPKVMYHGTNAQFSVFDKSKAKASGLYGKGFYFTDSSSQAGVYGNRMAVYLSIQTPLMPGESKITKDQIKRFLQAVSENEDYSIENFGTYDIDEIASKITSRDAFSVIQDINATAIGDFGEAIELFNKVNGTKYDGIITPTETVVFEPGQIKSATDNVGTYDRNNPDIYHQEREPSAFDVAPTTAEMTETAKKIKRAFGLNKSVDTITEELSALYSQLQKELAKEVPDFERIGELSDQTAERLISQKARREEFAQEILDNLKSAYKNSAIYLDDQQIGEINSDAEKGGD